MTRINKNQIKIGGGTTGQALVKLSNTDYDYDWGTVSGGGGSGTGTKLAIDTTATVINGTGLPITAYTIPIPGGTLGTNDAIRFDVSLSNFQVDNTEEITVDIQYGGTSIGTIIFDGMSDEIPLTSASVRGVLIADGATNSQKSLVQGISSVTNNPSSKPIITVTDTSTKDSTISQNLDIIVTNSGGTSSATVESIIVEKITDGGLQTKTVTLSDTDITGMYASPYTLVAAPGAGKVNVVESVLFYFDYGTVQYTGGGNVSIIEETSGTVLTTSFNDTFITAASNAIIQRNALAPVATSLTENKAIQLTNATGAFAAGDGTLKVVLNYRVITL